MDIGLPTLEGRFVRRYKRFFADVELADGTLVTAHCPNTGSLKGCLVEGARAVLRDSRDDQRKLRYVFQAIEIEGTLVNVDTALPNRVVYEAVVAGAIPELAGYDEARREVKYGENSRIDLLLSKQRSQKLCYVEVKNTTLAEGRSALFPDAVTSRGLKHLGELTSMVAQGHRAVQFFFVSRDDVRCFAPADEIDPAYCAALRVAAEAGVEVLAYSARVTPDTLDVARRLEVRLAAPRGARG
ncbi:MAG TPA: DNA/RNA nuclease SfsA [Planctomycetota bacterium]|nr:DNA/RNA nuclease SfsA [Planctomycetota bacterium]